MFRVLVQQRVVRSWASFIIAAALGVIAGLLMPVFSGWSGYRWILVAFIVFVMPVLFLLIRNAIRTLLVAFVFVLPFGFVFTPFGDAPYHEGGAQPVVAFILYDFPLIGLTALWLLEAYALRKPIRKSSTLVAAVLWIAWSILSVHNSVSPALSWLEILRMVKLCILMLAVSNVVRDKQDILAVVYALLLGLIAEGAICAIQYATGSNFNLGLFTVGELNRVSGTIGWPNTLGAYAAATTSMAFMLLIAKPNRSLGGLCLVAGIAGLFTLIVSFSRGAWIAFLVALILGIVMSYSRKLIGFKDMPQMALICLVLGFCIAPFVSPIASRLTQTSLLQGAIADRLTLDGIALNMIATHPVIGVGLNTFVEVMRAYDKTGLSYFLPYPVHNVYLLVAAETGLIGLALFSAFIVTVFRESVRAFRNRDRLVSSCAVGAMSSLTAILVSNLADDHLRTDVLFALFWFLAALVIALSRAEQSVQVRGQIPRSDATLPAVGRSRTATQSVDRGGRLGSERP